MRKRAVVRRFIGASAVMIATGAAVAAVVGTALAGWAGWAFFALVCLLVLTWAWASFTPNSPLFGKVLTGRGTHDRVLALTFDDGPSSEWTPRVLDALRASGARATFFVLGRHAEQHPELIRRISEEGHEIASHGYDHALLTFASQADVERQLERTEASLATALGRQLHPLMFRAPHGFRNPFVARVTSRRGYEMVGWTKGVWDTAKPGAEAIVRRTIGGFKPGGILLLHDADGSGEGDDRSQTVEAVPEIVERAHAAGYELVTVSELAIRAPAKRTAPWRIVAGLALFGVLLELALRSVNISTVTAVDVAWWWVIASLGLNLLSILLKAVVWKIALDTIPGKPRFLYAHVVPALFIGFLLNTLLPARIGEIARVAVLQRRLKLVGTDVPTATLAGSVVAEQIVLAIALVVIMALQLPFVNVPARFEHMILAFGGVIIVVLLAVIGLEMFSRRSRRRVRSDLAFARGQQALAMLHPIARGMQRGQTVLRRPRTAAGALAAGLASWAAQIAGIYAALACGRHPAVDRHGRARLPRLHARPAVPVLAGQRRALPGRGRAGARAGLSRRLPARDRVRGRPAGDRGLARRRPRASGSCRARVCPWRRSAASAATTERVKIRSDRQARVDTSAFPGAHVPPRGGDTGTYRSRYAQRWAGSPRFGCAQSQRRSHSRWRCWPLPALPADAARRPPGPKQAAPAARSVVRTAQVAFRWHKAKRAKGYDLRIARDRRFTSQMQTVHVRAAERTPAARSRTLVLEGPLDGQGQLALVEHHAGRRAPARATHTRPRARPRCGSRRSRADSVTVMFGASRDDGYVARYELLAGEQGDRPRERRAADRAEPALRHALHAARACRRRSRPCLRAVARRTHPHAALHRHDRARRTRQRARDHGRGHERRARLGRRSRSRRHRQALRRVPQRRAARPAQHHRVPGLAPGARHELRLHGRGNRRRRPPVRRERARPHDPGAAARDGPGLRLHAGDHGSELRGPAAALHADRRRLADLLPPGPRPRHPRPGRRRS